MNDYPYIRAWTRLMGYPEKVEDIIAQARSDGAPQDAIGYEPSDDLWLTVDDIATPLLAQRVRTIVSLAEEQNHAD